LVIMKAPFPHYLPVLLVLVSFIPIRTKTTEVPGIKRIFPWKGLVWTPKKTLLVTPDYSWSYWKISLAECQAMREKTRLAANKIKDEIPPGATTETEAVTKIIEGIAAHEISIPPLPKQASGPTKVEEVKTVAMLRCPSLKARAMTVEADLTTKKGILGTSAKVTERLQYADAIATLNQDLMILVGELREEISKIKVSSYAQPKSEWMQKELARSADRLVEGCKQPVPTDYQPLLVPSQNRTGFSA
jgi:hypothetical protein